MEASQYGLRLSALVGLMGSVFPLSFSKTQALLDQLLGVEISRGAIAAIRQCLSAALAEPMAQALRAARQQPVAYVDETGPRQRRRQQSHEKTRLPVGHGHRCSNSVHAGPESIDGRRHRAAGQQL